MSFSRPPGSRQIRRGGAAGLIPEVMTAAGVHHRIDRATARPRPRRGLGMDLYHWLGDIALGLGGWRCEGDWPTCDRAVVVCAPHTSNWDGVWMLAAAGHYRVRLRYMGKQSLTQGPFGWFVKWTGCVPIDRSRRNDVVQAMADAFAAEEQLTLAIPPEGTREAVDHWKSGFYHIAVAARVPIILAVLDYGTRTVRISGLLRPSGDYAADFPLIASHYAGMAGKHPAKFRIAI